MDENSTINIINSKEPADEYKVFNDDEISTYYDNLKIQIRLLTQKYNLQHHDFTDKIVVNNIWEYKELFPKNDTYALELAEFLNILFRSINSDNAIELKFSSKKIKIQSEITKQRISYLINTLLIEELRDDFTLDTELNIDKSFRFKNDLKELIKNIDIEQSVQSNLYSKIINLSSELLTSQELTAILNIIRLKNSQINIDKYSNLKRNDLKVKIKNIITELRKINVFDNSLKTIGTKEACFLYDILGLSNIIEIDPFFNNQEKFQYIKRHYI